MQRTRSTHGPDATRALARSLAARAFPGCFVALHGDLGAGKTVFAQGFGEGLGVTTRVTSPTFVLVAAHEGGRLPLWHADWYRLGSEDELDALGFDELLLGGVMLVEWASRFPDALPDDRLEVTLDGDGDTRQVTVVATGPRHAALLGALDA